MNVVLSSLFRNSEQRLGNYFKQVEALVNLIGHHYSIRLLAGEGDSTDRTRSLLSQPRSIPVEVWDVSHGGPAYGSTEQPERMVQLSRVWNRLLDGVLDTDDIFMYVENDLIWDAVTLSRLIDRAANWQNGYDVFAPMVFAGQNFYDVWGFRGKDGGRFAPFPPYHNGLNGDALSEVYSAGSCLAMRAIVARNCRIRNDYAIVGWCQDVREQGYKIAVCTDLKIRHP